MLSGPPEIVERSRRLRREMSLPEVLLWRELKLRPGGLKFRKQHPAGPYTADFFCHEARLVIEVDGEAHGRADRPQRDDRRDAWFAERRFRVMRIPAEEVLRDLESVVRGIIAAANPPPEGEGDHAKHGGGVSAMAETVLEPSITRTLTPLRQASPATSPVGGG